jgi:hypothetical protein
MSDFRVVVERNPASGIWFAFVESSCQRHWVGRTYYRRQDAHAAAQALLHRLDGQRQLAEAL